MVKSQSHEKELDEEKISESDIAKFQEELEKLEFKPLQESARQKARKDIEEHKTRGFTKRKLTRRHNAEREKVKDGF